MWLNIYLCIFMIYSFLGWIYESTYCTVKERKWENRGFLYGPVCPIYGAGAVIIIFLSHRFTSGGTLTLTPWQVFLISMLGSAVLEYMTSWVLEKRFHAVWWDYSHLPLNLQGRISLLTSIGFGLGGLLIVYVLAPVSDGLLERLPEQGTQMAALLGVILITVDTTLTVSALTSFERIVVSTSDSFDRHMENLVENVHAKVSGTRRKISAAEQILERLPDTIGNSGRAALRRVAEFRYNNVSREKMSRVLEALKEKRPGIHKSDE